MFNQRFHAFLIVTFILTMVRCSKDQLAFNPLLTGEVQTIFDHGDVRQIALTSSEVYFSLDEVQLGVYDRSNTEVQFYNNINSTISIVKGLQTLNDSTVLVGRNTGGAMRLTDSGFVHHFPAGTMDRFSLNNHLIMSRRSGVWFKNYGAYIGGTDPFITSLACDGDTGWIGTAERGLFFLTKSKVISTYNDFGDITLQSDSVMDVHLDMDNNLFVLTTKELLIKRSGNWTQYISPPGVINISMNVWNGRVLIATFKRIHMLLDDKIVPTGRLNHHLPSGVVNHIESDENGYLWIGTSNGLHYYGL